MVLSFLEKKKYVLWPSESERNEIAIENERILEFPNLVEFIDSCKLDAEFSPNSVSPYAVCDNNRSIRYIYTGHLGFSNDMLALEDNEMGRNSEKFFSPF